MKFALLFTVMAPAIAIVLGLFGISLYVELPLELTALLLDTDFAGAYDVITSNIPFLATLSKIIVIIISLEIVLGVSEFVIKYKNVFS